MQYPSAASAIVTGSEDSSAPYAYPANASDLAVVVAVSRARAFFLCLAYGPLVPNWIANALATSENLGFRVATLDCLVDGCGSFWLPC
jgi:hypothetical protein